MLPPQPGGVRSPGGSFAWRCAASAALRLRFTWLRYDHTCLNRFRSGATRAYYNGCFGSLLPGKPHRYRGNAV